MHEIERNRRGKSKNNSINSRERERISWKMSSSLKEIDDKGWTNGKDEGKVKIVFPFMVWDEKLNLRSWKDSMEFVFDGE